jgi:hypothetical protein
VNRRWLAVNFGKGSKFMKPFFWKTFGKFPWGKWW